MANLREVTQENHGSPETAEQITSPEKENDNKILPFSNVSHSKESAYAFTALYVKNAERRHSLGMPVDKGLIDLIARFFFVRDITFDECHEKLTLSEDKKHITGKSSCSAYCAFTKLMNNDGKSVYRWGLRMDKLIDCYRSVGIVTEEDRKGWQSKSFAHWMKPGSNGYDDDLGLYFSGFVKKWAVGEVITVELDYGKSTVTLHRIPKDSPKTLFRTCKIESDKSYYFGLLLCTSPSNAVSVVDLDDDGNVLK